jgi:broad specificity phosphatase PhoE
MKRGCTGIRISKILTSAEVGRIILVRHGETEANRRRHFAESDEIPLTDTGRLQAEEVALRLARDFRPTMLFSSSFARARETAEIISRALRLNTGILEGIHERDFGSLRGLPYESFDALYDRVQSWTWSPDGGESMRDVEIRAGAALENLRSLYDSHEIVVVCHGAVIRAVCGHITGDYGMNVVPNCAVVVVEYGPEGWAKLSQPAQTPA